MFKRIIVPLVALLLGAAFASAASAARYVVVLDEGVDSDALAAYHEGFAGVSIGHRYRHALNGYAAEITTGGSLAAIKADGRVAFVSTDRVMRTAAQTLPTGINRIDGELSSTASGNGSGAVNVNVAVIDTGISAHSDLNVVGGKSCTVGLGWDDANGHGTHVAGTIAAKDDGNGVVGVAPGANLYAVKVLTDAGVGLTSDIICGIDWVTSTRTDLNPNNNIAVANMSLGGGGSDDNNCGNSNNDAYHRSICNSVNAGVVHVVAAGNDGVDFRSTSPATYGEVLTVTAIADFNGVPGGGAAATCRNDVDDTEANFSNWAVLAADQNHTIAAPGVCINSTWMLGGYNTISGTSMASPHVAGVAALCISTGACTGTPAQVISKLRADAQSYNTANPGYGFTSPGGRYYGYLTRASY
jgi:subtilisin